MVGVGRPGDGMVGEEADEAEVLDCFRAYSENEKHWQARRAFLLRHLPADGMPAASRLDQLLALSMVWANHVFLGCSYSRDLLDKVTDMAEGITVEDAPRFTTRDELMRKHQR
ncbi:PREDICTED: CDKN2AIP N-terminal-like protein [Gavialis gangeticus]|uniref:CDKN2AIP N-terminal-like protein n=1 Tax=Gavialis gangeticus TaxID=94835 RepID=UPI00092F6108|nr:PREDICTED: CDKN2AIP N-terminal-like protein [Gavialis gangeticus]